MQYCLPGAIILHIPSNNNPQASIKTTWFDLKLRYLE
jgi:hypothetical protein